jgi:hypothetical protein
MNAYEFEVNRTRLSYTHKGLVYKSGTLVKVSESGDRLMTEKGDEFVQDADGYHLAGYPERRMIVQTNRSQAVSESKTLLIDRESIRNRLFTRRKRARGVAIMSLDRSDARRVIRNAADAPVQQRRPLDFSGLAKLVHKDREGSRA